MCFLHHLLGFFLWAFIEILYRSWFFWCAVRRGRSPCPHPEAAVQSLSRQLLEDPSFCLQCQMRPLLYIKLLSVCLFLVLVLLLSYSYISSKSLKSWLFHSTFYYRVGPTSTAFNLFSDFSWIFMYCLAFWASESVYSIKKFLLSSFLEAGKHLL